MQAILLSLVLLCLSPMQMGAGAAVLKSPRTVAGTSSASRPTPKVAHTCVEGDPTTTLRGIFSTSTADPTSTSTSIADGSDNDDDGLNLPSQLLPLSTPTPGTDPKQPPRPTGVTSGEDEEDTSNQGNLTDHAGLADASTPIVRIAAAAADADAGAATPTTTPPPADEEAQRAFREEYGDRYTQLTYWSCASAGVFAGRCGWHMPIVEVAAASGTSSAGGGSGGGGVVRAVVAGLVGFMVGGLVLAV